MNENDVLNEENVEKNDEEIVTEANAEIAEEPDEETNEEFDEDVVLEKDFVEDAKSAYEEKTKKNHKNKMTRKLKGTNFWFTVLRVLIVIVAIALIAAIVGFGAYYTYKLAMGTYDTFMEFIMRRFDHDPAEHATAVGAYLMAPAFILVALGIAVFPYGGIILIGGGIFTFYHSIRYYYATVEGFWSGVGRFFYGITFIFDFVVLVIVNLFLLAVLVLALVIVFYVSAFLIVMQDDIGFKVKMAQLDKTGKISQKLLEDTYIDYEKFYESKEYKDAAGKNAEEIQRLISERNKRRMMLKFNLGRIETKNVVNDKKKK